MGMINPIGQIGTEINDKNGELASNLSNESFVTKQ